MKKTTYSGTEFHGLPLYQPWPGHEEKEMGFDLATLQRADAILRQALARNPKILAVEITLAYPAEINTQDIGNECISEFLFRYCRRLREHFGQTVDFLQVREHAPRTGRLHHHVVFLIGGDWWHFVDYGAVREYWRKALSDWFDWPGTAAEAPVHISDNWNGMDEMAAYGFLVDAARPEQVSELYRRMSYLAKNYSRDLTPGVRSFTSSEIR